MKNIAMLEPSAELTSLAGSLMVAMGHAKTMNERVLKVKAELLESEAFYSDPFYTDDRRMRIRNPAHTWKIERPSFDEFHVKLDAAIEKAGLKAMKPGCCPALEAETLARDAQKAFIAVLFAELNLQLPMPMDRMQLKHLDKMAELGLKMVGRFVNQRSLARKYGLVLPSR